MSGIGFAGDELRVQVSVASPRGSSGLRRRGDTGVRSTAGGPTLVRGTIRDGWWSWQFSVPRYAVPQTRDYTVNVTDRLSFQVNVKNSGDSQETQVLVTLTIKQDPGITKTQTIPVISPSETKTVVFQDLPPPTFGSPVKVLVSVDPVPGESNTSNNSYEYPVIFSIG